MTPLEIRRETKKKLIEVIKNNVGMDINTISAIFSLQTGMRMQTIKTYIKELELAGLIEVKHDIITHVETPNNNK